MSPLRLLRAILEATEGGIDGASASCYADWLQREGLLSAREASLLRAASARETLGVPLPERDRLRARLFRAMVLALFAGPSEAASDGVEDPRQ
jgi:transcriptional regulator CtsR